MVNPKYLCLDKGWVEELQITDSDASIADLARETTRGKLTKYRPDKEFIRYLWLHKHFSPFDFPRIRLRFHMPMFVRNQMWRHRTSIKQSSQNKDSELIVETDDNDTLQFHNQQEFSGRYWQYNREYYLPPSETLTKPHARLKQSRGDDLVPNWEELLRRMEEEQILLDTNYRYYLQNDLSKEVARVNIPLSLYTTFVWEQSLRNMLGWLELRRAQDAQWEIQVYAEIIEHIIKEHFPFTYEVWYDGVEGCQLAKSDLEELYKYLDGVVIDEKFAKKIKFIN